MARSDGNHAEASRLLGINRITVRGWLDGRPEGGTTAPDHPAGIAPGPQGSSACSAGARHSGGGYRARHFALGDALVPLLMVAPRGIRRLVASDREEAT